MMVAHCRDGDELDIRFNRECEIPCVLNGTVLSLLIER